METQQLLLWLVPLLPLAGFLFNAFFGARLTGSPRPIVEDGATTSAPAHNAGHSDAATFEHNPEVTAAGHDADYSEGPAAAAQVAHDAHAAPAHAADRGSHGGHGGHEESPLSPGGTKIVGGIATGAVAASFVCAVMLFLSVLGMQGDVRHIVASGFTWMHTPAIGVANSLGYMPALDVHFDLAVDPLSSLMLLIITGVGALIHLYSTGYMSHDKGYARYFGYLNLFVFFMLILVMAANLPLLFVGWEGVGLASYLLIGFYYQRKSANDAGKKAFIVNRIGDCALLIAMFLIFKCFGTLDFFTAPHVGATGQAPLYGIFTQEGLNQANQVYSQPIFLGLAASFWVPLLMFIGAAGKSAQIPLYVWLPDAMEGPTPVSALIHAATMVTGGVYLVCRAHILFLDAPDVMTIVAVIGVSTAFLAATIGLVQNDIKRVLAYSTVSQLGYMFLACGVGAFGSAMFHVATHAFFKALLFLRSGSVIHAMGGEQDMRKMGGLGGKIKLTAAMMLIGTLAITGIPPFAGFWSKDEILLNAYANSTLGGLGAPALWFTGFVVAGMTAFYMVRLMMKTFGGTQTRDSADVVAHIHESPPSMTVPLIVLAVLSIFGGALNAKPAGAWLDHFLGTTVDWRDKANMPLQVESVENTLLIASAVLAIVVCAATWAIYRGKPSGDLSTEAQKQRNPLWRILYDKWHVDQIYDDVIVNPGIELARTLWRTVDNQVVDGAVKGVSACVNGLANGLFKKWQSGYVRNYALSMLVGVALVIVCCLIGMSAGLAR